MQLGGTFAPYEARGTVNGVFLTEQDIVLSAYVEETSKGSYRDGSQPRSLTLDATVTGPSGTGTETIVWYPVNAAAVAAP